MKKTTKVILAWLAAAMVAAALFSPVFFRCGNLSLPVVSDNLPPAAPAMLSAVATRCRGVTLTWNGSYDTHSVLKTYRVYQNGSLLAETHGTPELLRAKTREYRVTGLADGTAYTFGVSAVDIYGHASAPAAFPAVTTLPADHAYCADTAPPTAPAGFAAAPVPGACRSVALSLSGASTDGQSGLDHYEIYRDGMKIAVTNTGNYAAERFGLVPGKTYDYWLTAVDKAGNESARGNVVHYAVPDCANVVAGGNLKTLILAVNLPGRPAPAVTMGEIERLAFGMRIVVNPGAVAFVSPFNEPNMRAFYLEQTYGRISLVKAGVLGWIQLTGGINAYCTQFTPAGVGFNCNMTKIKTDALAKAAAGFGLNPNAPVDRYILVVNGQAENQAGGNTVFLSDFDLGTAIHEMGHTFGVEHAAGWTGRKFDALVGAQLTLPLDFADLPFGAFDLSEYGDPRNRMGGPVINHFAAFQKELLGALPPSQVAHAAYDRDFILDAVESPSTGFKELRIPVKPGAGTGKAPFVTAEYRNGKGYDAAAPQGGQTFRGVQLRLVPERFFGAASDTMYVGEMTAQSPVFTDWHRRMKYTLVSMDDAHAVVHVCGLGWGLVYELTRMFHQ
jgi:hypothetical protein